MISEPSSSEPASSRRWRRGSSSSRCSSRARSSGIESARLRGVAATGLGRGRDGGSEAARLARAGVRGEVGPNRGRARVQIRATRRGTGEKTGASPRVRASTRNAAEADSCVQRTEWRLGPSGASLTQPNPRLSSPPYLSRAPFISLLRPRPAFSPPTTPLSSSRTASTVSFAFYAPVPPRAD